MKITLEINTANMQDIMDAMNTLKAFAPAEQAVLIEDASYSHEKEGDVKEIGGVDFDMLNEIKAPIVDNELEDLKAELQEVKANLNKVKNEKDELVKENKSLTDKVSSLEIELSAVPMEPTEILDDEKSVNVVNEEYERKIEELNKQVSFHEGRSNKNFEEVKRLRVLVDNLSSEKRDSEKKIASLTQKIESLESMADEASGIDYQSLKAEHQSLTDKVSSLEHNKEKLLKEIDFHKGRSKTNWENLKTLEADCEVLRKEKAELEEKIKEINSNTDNLNNKEDIESIKSELIQVKSEYESTISELRLANDKLQNELNLCKTKYSEDALKELEHLKKVRQVICGNEKGAIFWNNVESSITNS